MHWNFRCSLYFWWQYITFIQFVFGGKFSFSVYLHQVHSSHLLSLFFQGDSDITLYGPIYVTTAYFYDGPTYTADESPLSGQCWNSERAFCMGSGMCPGILFENNLYKSPYLNCKIYRSWTWSIYDSICPFFIVQFMAANTPMQGAYIPQYAHMQTSTVPVEVGALTCSLLRVKHSSSISLARCCKKNSDGKELFYSLF